MIYRCAVHSTTYRFPWFQAFAEGFQEITKARGGESNPKPSWLNVDLQATYWRLFLGLTAGVVLSNAVGILMGSYTVVEALLNPIITFFAKIPPTAMLAVYMVAFGIHLKMYVPCSHSASSSQWPSHLSSREEDVASDHIDKAYTLGASEWK